MSARAAAQTQTIVRAGRSATRTVGASVRRTPTDLRAQTRVDDPARVWFCVPFFWRSLALCVEPTCKRARPAFRRSGMSSAAVAVVPSPVAQTAPPSGSIKTPPPLSVLEDLLYDIVA